MSDIIKDKTFSTIKDITNDLIKNYSKESDHQEAREYIEKVLAKCGCSLDELKDVDILKEMSVIYATYKRAFYESKVKDDLFYQKYIELEKDLINITAKVIKQYIK